MKYKYIPVPSLVDDEQARPLYRKDDDVFIIGWEIGHMVGEEEAQEWVKIREEMTLTPEAEAEWQAQQAQRKTVSPTSNELLNELLGVSE